MTYSEQSHWVTCFRCDRIHSRDEIGPCCLYAPSSLSPEADAVVRALAPLFEPTETWTIPPVELDEDEATRKLTAFLDLDDHRNG